MAEEAAVAAAAGEARQGAGPVAPSSGVPVRPDYLPEKFWRDTGPDVEALAKSYSELERRLATKREQVIAEYEAERQRALPQRPEEYEIKLPEGFAPPEGYEMTIDPNDPMAEEARRWAYKHRLPKEVFQEGVALFTKALAASLPDLKAERQKLGEKADERLAVLDGWLAANLKEPHYKALVSVAQRAEVVEAIEALMRMAGAEGVPGTGSRQPDLSGDRPFQTLAEVEEAMMDRRYFEDPNYRAKVFEKALAFYEKNPKKG